MNLFKEKLFGIPFWAIVIAGILAGPLGWIVTIGIGVYILLRNEKEEKKDILIDNIKVYKTNLDYGESAVIGEISVLTKKGDNIALGSTVTASGYSEREGNASSKPQNAIDGNGVSWFYNNQNKTSPENIAWVSNEYKEGEDLPWINLMLKEKIPVGDIDKIEIFTRSNIRQTDDITVELKNGDNVIITKNVQINPTFNSLKDCDDPTSDSCTAPETDDKSKWRHRGEVTIESFRGENNLKKRIRKGTIIL